MSGQSLDGPRIWRLCNKIQILGFYWQAFVSSHPQMRAGDARAARMELSAPSKGQLLLTSSLDLYMRVVDIESWDFLINGIRSNNREWQAG